MLILCTRTIYMNMLGLSQTHIVAYHYLGKQPLQWANRVIHSFMSEAFDLNTNLLQIIQSR